MPKLLIEESGQSSVFELFDDEVQIGRGASNAIQVADAHASKNHAVIRKVGGRLKFVDLESRNGTLVNSEFRNQRFLEHGDRIEIGAARVTYDASDLVSRAGAGSGSGTGVVSRPPGGARSGVSRSPVARSGGASRRRRDEDDDGEERERRGPPARSSNSAAIGILVGLGALGVMALFFVMMGGKQDPNVVLRQEAEKLRAAGQYDEALLRLERLDSRHADTYDGGLELKEKIRREMATRAETARGQGALAAYNKLAGEVRQQWTTKVSDEDLGGRIRQFMRDFAGSAEVKGLELRYSDLDKKMMVVVDRAEGRSK